MARFFVDAQQLLYDHITLDGENAVHARVLRLKAGETVTLCDGQGNDAVCRVEDVSADGFRVTVQERRRSLTEPETEVSIFMAYSKADKLEHVIQKATELGACEIAAFPTARCVSRPDDRSLDKKLDRWRKIAASAAEQSGRGRVPRVTALYSYQDALKRAAKADLPILFYENEKATTLKMALSRKPYRTVSLMTGPEGGLEFSEVEMAKAAGLHICTLGSRILRCETAPLCGLSAVMYEAGEF